MRSRLFPEHGFVLGCGAMLVRTRSWLALSCGVLVLASALLAAPGRAQSNAAQAQPRARLGSLFAPAAPGAGAQPELAEIAELIRQLEHHAHAQAARDALGQARSALARARAATVVEDRGRAIRAKQSAWAALGLASRRIALAAAQRARVVAELRAQRAERERADAEQRLEQARMAAPERASER